MNFILKTLFLLMNVSCLECVLKYTCSDDVCFYLNGLTISSFSEVQQQCRQNGYKLLELFEERVGKTFEDIYKSWTSDDTLSGNNVWLNLKSITFDWTWVDGIHYRGVVNVGFSNNKEYYAIITFDSASGNIFLRESTSNRDLPFICSSDGCEDSTCVSFHTSTFMNWFDARYECFKMGKDLAVLNWVTNFTKDLPELQLHSGREFWLGLTKREFKWQDSNTTLKYANWSVGQPALDGDCVFISGYMSNKWITSECSAMNFIVICMNDSKTSTSKISSTQKSYWSDTTSSGTPSPAKTNPLTQYLGIGLGVGISFSILLIIAIIVGVCYFSKKSKRKKSDLSQNYGNNFINSEYDEIGQPITYEKPEIIKNIITTKTEPVYSPVVSNPEKVARGNDANIEKSEDLINYIEIAITNDNDKSVGAGDISGIEIPDLQNASMPEYATINKQLNK